MTGRDYIVNLVVLWGELMAIVFMTEADVFEAASIKTGYIVRAVACWDVLTVIASIVPVVL